MTLRSHDHNHVIPLYVYKAEHEQCHGHPVHHRRRKGLFGGAPWRTKPPKAKGQRQYMFIEDQICTYLSLVAISLLEKRQPLHSFSIPSPQRVFFFRSKVSSQILVLDGCIDPNTLVQNISCVESSVTVATSRRRLVTDPPIPSSCNVSMS